MYYSRFLLSPNNPIMRGRSMSIFMENFSKFCKQYMKTSIFIIPFAVVICLPNEHLRAAFVDLKVSGLVIAGGLIVFGAFHEWLSGRMLGRALLHASNTEPREGLTDEYYSAICSIGRVWQIGIVSLAWGFILLARLITL